MKWCKGTDFLDNTPLYYIQDHLYNDSYYRHQVIITSKRVRIEREKVSYKLLYFPLVYDRNKECAWYDEESGIASLKKAKEKTVEIFNYMIEENGKNKEEVAIF